MFRNTFSMRDFCKIHLSLGDQGYCVRPQLWYVLLVHVVYKKMLQSACSTPICRDSRVNHKICNTFHMRDYCIIHLSLGDQG